MSARSPVTEESPWAEDLALIMSDGTGPFTRKMLAIELQKKFTISWQNAMTEISYALLADKRTKKRFVRIKQGWWDLAQ